jgi:predicted hydrocarbon binding protein
MTKKKHLKNGMFMPADAIKSLRLELGNLLKEKLAAGVLFRFGYKCGEALVESDNPKILEESSVESALPKIWDVTGLGSISKIEEISEDEIIIEIIESTEAKVLGSSDAPSCDYTRGYLAGICSALTKKKFYSVETDCLSQNKKTCKFQLVVFPHRVYVPKKTR